MPISKYRFYYHTYFSTRPKNPRKIQLFYRKMTTETPQFATSCGKLYRCDICDLTTSRKNDYEKHILTGKHLKKAKMITMTTNVVQNRNSNVCECGSTYSCRQNLYRHRKKCSMVIENSESDVEFPKENTDVSTKNASMVTTLTKTSEEMSTENSQITSELNTDVLLSLVNQNKELQGLLTKQQEQMKAQQDFMKEQQEQMKIQQEQIKSMVPRIGNSTTNKLNLNIFLNETCKDALNITDFIKSLPLCLKDLDNTGKLGYVDGISKIFIDGLSSLELTKRPIHCSDLKREILYVKDNDVWEKENQEKERMKKAIKHLGRANTKQLPKWVEENPDCTQQDSQKNNMYHQIIQNTMQPHDEKNTRNIIRNIAKNTILP